ncbi:MAG TPA: hypothetical protein VM692_12585 [Gammaproteobacteria bacterium]|nr:hypothetical protein [Gammaproteobacteria bacterium]
MLPKGHWLLHTFAAAALCAGHAAACAQSAALPDETANEQRSSLPAPELTQPPAIEPPAVEQPAAEPSAVEPPAVESPVVEPPPAEPLASEHAGGEAPPVGIGNGDVLAMVEAQFSDATIVSIIGANDARFDLSPRALVGLKGAGVSEDVIAAMIAAAAEKRDVAEPELAATAETQASLDYAKLTQMIEQLAAKQEAAAAERRDPTPPASRADPAPHVWLVGPAEKAAIAPTIAQVAFAGGGRRNNERMKNLQGIAGQALAFVNPAVSGIATTLGSLFRPEEQRTAVWALAATSSTRVLDFDPVFEMDFAHIPGVDPDRYQPTIVQLVATNDNYRLVAAAETDGSNTGALPSGPIIEESVATEATRLGRGQYRVTPRAALPPGEYALVLRPIAESKRARRREAEASLGELLGGSTSQILYLTWEFSIAAR